jgi:hypothetical protein
LHSLAAGRNDQLAEEADFHPRLCDQPSTATRNQYRLKCGVPTQLADSSVNARRFYKFSLGLVS